MSTNSQNSKASMDWSLANTINKTGKLLKALQLPPMDTGSILFTVTTQLWVMHHLTNLDHTPRFVRIYRRVGNVNTDPFPTPFLGTQARKCWIPPINTNKEGIVSQIIHCYPVSWFNLKVEPEDIKGSR